MTQPTTRRTRQTEHARTGQRPRRGHAERRQGERWQTSQQPKRGQTRRRTNHGQRTKPAQTGRPKQAQAGRTKQTRTGRPKQAQPGRTKQTRTGRPKQAQTGRTKQTRTEQAQTGRPKQAQTGRTKQTRTEQAQTGRTKQAQTGRTQRPRRMTRVAQTTQTTRQTGGEGWKHRQGSPEPPRRLLKTLAGLGPQRAVAADVARLVAPETDWEPVSRKVGRGRATSHAGLRAWLWPGTLLQTGQRWLDGCCGGRQVAQ